MKSTHTVPYRRKREGRTDYQRRLKLLASNKPRIVVRKSLKNIQLQVIEYSPTGDKVLLNAHSRELAKYGWKADMSNTPAAYLVGFLLGTKAKKTKLNEGIADIGGHTSVKGCVVYAALKGVSDAGMNVPLSEDVVPNTERLQGEHIARWAAELKAKDPARYQRVFSKYLKNSLNPEELPKHMAQVKQKIMGGA